MPEKLKTAGLWLAVAVLLFLSLAMLVDAEELQPLVPCDSQIARDIFSKYENYESRKIYDERDKFPAVWYIYAKDSNKVIAIFKGLPFVTPFGICLSGIGMQEIWFYSEEEEDYILVWKADLECKSRLGA